MPRLQQKLQIRRSGWLTCLAAALLLAGLSTPRTYAQAQAPQAGAAASPEPVRLRDRVYGRKLGVALTMDVFLPAPPARGSGVGVIWMVSGGWRSNHDAINPGLARVFTDRGHTVFQVVHGSQPKFALPEIVGDIHRAVRFIRGHSWEYGVDPERLAIAGGSAGGHLSLMMAAYGAAGDPNAKDPIDRLSSRVQAVAAFFPPTDFLNYGKEGQRALSYEELRPFWHVFGVAPGATPEQRDQTARTFSPLYGLSKESPPILLFHGDADTLVPLQQSQVVMSKLEELKVPHKLVVREGKAHGWAGMDKDLAEMAGWFEEHLKRPANK